MSLARVHAFAVSSTVVSDTERALKRAGREQCELFALWTGVYAGRAFQVQHLYVPTQSSYRLSDGLCVRVDHDELDRLNRWLYAEGQVLAVQVHTHPTEAYHSDTDNTYPIVTALGGLSIVVPDFCAHGLGGDGTVVFRLSTSGWEELSARQMKRVFRWDG